MSCKNGSDLKSLQAPAGAKTTVQARLLATKGSAPILITQWHSVVTLTSGRKIIQILEKNPNKDSSKHDEEDIQDMRKVVSYNKRHLAQEGKAKQDPQSRSAKILKNWRHDPQKAS